MTVSRVINLEPTVHADTVQKVRRAIETLHYRPDATARSLRGTRSFTIALVYDDNPNANYILSLQNGVLGACREHGYELLIYPCDPRSPRLTDELSLLAKNARLTAKHNGVIIHDNTEIDGKTGGARADPEGTPGPIRLQGHGNPTQFRNIWIVEQK